MIDMSINPLDVFDKVRLRQRCDIGGHAVFVVIPEHRPMGDVTIPGREVFVPDHQVEMRIEHGVIRNAPKRPGWLATGR